MNETFMKDRPVLPLVLSMSLPMVLSMLVNSLYNIVDSFFVAQISEDAMTALSLVYPVQNLITAVGVGFGIGINAVIAFHLGAGEKDKADRAASQGMLLSVVHGVGLTLLCILGLPAFLGAFTQSPSVLALGVAYGQVAFAFTLIIVLGLTFEKTFQAVGRMKATMASLLAGCVTNIVLDPLLIFGLGPFPQLGTEDHISTGGGGVAQQADQLFCHLAGNLHFAALRLLVCRQRELHHPLVILRFAPSLGHFVFQHSCAAADFIGQHGKGVFPQLAGGVRPHDGAKEEEGL